ncbi:MAG: magnesium transporter [Candidatus Heimdallarchaeota archaeon]
MTEKFFRESFLALSVTVIGGLLTGIIWSSLYDSFLLLAGVIALIPVISQMRGNISGIFTSRLGTGLHLGYISPSFTKRSNELNNSILMNVILSFLIPIWVAFVVYLFNFIGNGQTPFFRFLIIGFLGSIFAGSVQIIITLFIAFKVYKKGMDPDVVVYPILSLTADIITVLVIFVAFNIENFLYIHVNFFFQILLEMIFIFIFILFLIIIFSRPIRSKIDFELVNLLAESVPVVLITVIIGGIVGIILNDSIPYQGIILILPVFMAFTGSMSSIVGSTLTTAYHLGSPMKQFYINIPLVLILVGSILSILLGIIGYSISILLGFSLPNESLIFYLAISFFTGLFTTIFSIIISLILGNITFKKGIDADNVIVPITSTIGDLVAILSMVLLLFILV